MHYEIGTITVTNLLPAIVRAEDQLARLDEAVRHRAESPGFVARSHYGDAAASLWLSGELVHIEDLVLHDYGQDVRAPTNELVVAHKILRVRRRLADCPAAWGLSAGAVATLLGNADGQGGDAPFQLEDEFEAEPYDDVLRQDISKIDTLLKRSADLMATLTNPTDATNETLAIASRPAHEGEGEGEGRLAAWFALIPQLEDLPATLSAAILWDAWRYLAPSPRQDWLGSLLISSLLRRRGKVTSHLPCLNLGMKTIARQRRFSHDRETRWRASLEGFALTGEVGMKEITRLHQARLQLEQKLMRKRSSSHLPKVVNLLLTRPLISAPMVVKDLKISHRAALNLIAELGVREITGRGRFQAWAVM